MSRRFSRCRAGIEFRFDIRQDRIGIWIDYSSKEWRALCHADRATRAADQCAILRACLRRPFGSRRVLALIHWQALKLCDERRALSIAAPNRP